MQSFYGHIANKLLCYWLHLPKFESLKVQHVIYLKKKKTTITEQMNVISSKFMLWIYENILDETEICYVLDALASQRRSKSIRTYSFHPAQKFQSSHFFFRYCERFLLVWHYVAFDSKQLWPSVTADGMGLLRASSGILFAQWMHFLYTF